MAKLTKKKIKKIVYGVEAAAAVLIAVFAPQWLQNVNIENSSANEIINIVQNANGNNNVTSNTTTNNEVQQSTIKQDNTGWTAEDSIGEIEPINYFVKRVVDGDTIVIDYKDKEKKLRLIGVDTPETVKANTEVQEFGPEASAFTKKMLEGKEIQIEFDEDKYDTYARLLAYVYVDGVMFNKLLIENGLAKAVKYEPNGRYYEKLLEVQEKAKENKLGIWSK